MPPRGRAAGVCGAFAAGHEDVIEWFLQSPRPYLFPPPTPPMIAAALLESLAIIDEDRERRAHLREMIALFADSLKLKYCRLPYSETAIQPIIVGDNARALYFAD